MGTVDGFSPAQIGMLEAKLDAGAVKSRLQAGRSLSYIEGWHAIAEANRIFGFDGWARQTTETRLVAEHQRKIGREPNQKDGWGVSYIAKVRVVVFATDTESLIREGIGAGHGIDVDLGLAHESAIKEAETDAMKRALMTFGNPFGLALYDKSQENVSNPADDAAANLVELIGMATTITALESTKRTGEFKAAYVRLPDEQRHRVEAAFKARAATLVGAAA
jgi:DNA recombination protein Rad52